MRKRGFEKVSLEQFIKDMKSEFYFDEQFCTELYNGIELPKRGTKDSAGYDFFAPMAFKLKKGQTIKLPTGIKSYMQQGEMLTIHPRSGLGFKYFCRLANTTGVIDRDYYDNENNEGHIWVKLRNEGNKDMSVDVGIGMCQGILQPFLLSDDDSFEGEQRKGGFGSTD